jgi:hypothetical protein
MSHPPYSTTTFRPMLMSEELLVIEPLPPSRRCPHVVQHRRRRARRRVTGGGRRHQVGVRFEGVHGIGVELGRVGEARRPVDGRLLEADDADGRGTASPPLGPAVEVCRGDD